MPAARVDKNRLHLNWHDIAACLPEVHNEKTPESGPGYCIFKNAHEQFFLFWQDRYANASYKQVIAENVDIKMFDKA
jgi:hypothetical protein